MISKLLLILSCISLAACDCNQKQSETESNLSSVATIASFSTKSHHVVINKVPVEGGFLYITSHYSGVATTFVPVK